MDTRDLIQQLSAEAAPVRRLPPPWRRAALWFAVTVPYIAAVILLNAHGFDSLDEIDVRFLVEQGAILATAVAAAVAAFSSVVPGRTRAWLYAAPLVPLAVWVVSLGQGCVQDFIRLGSDGLQLGRDWLCARAALMAGVLPALAMVLMLRRGAPLTPRISVAYGVLAAAALTSFAVGIFHVGDVSINVLVWHFGALALVSLLASAVGRLVMPWRLRAPA